MQISQNQQNCHYQVGLMYKAIIDWSSKTRSELCESNRSQDNQPQYLWPFGEVGVGGSSDFEQESHGSLFGGIKGEESIGQWISVECLCVADALHVAETNESALSVVPTIAAFANSTEWKMAVQQLDDWIVDHICAWTCMSPHVFDVVWWLAVEIDH